MPYKCCVPTCTYKQDAKLHRFPADAERLEKWCQLLGREDLLNKGHDHVRKYFRVCDEHFAEDAKFTTHNNRTNLKADSCPSVALPMQIDMVQAACTDAHGMLAEEVHSEIPAQEGPIASTSADVLHVASTSRMPHHTGKMDTGTDAPKTSVIKRKQKILQRRRNLLLEVQLRRKAQLTPKAAKLYEVAKEFRQIAQRLQYENESNRERVKEALKCAETGSIFKKKINEATFRFLQSQITQQEKKPKGRRFSFEDKVLALSLLKQNPRGYKLLKQIFALPSRKTLMALLSQIPFDCGINIPILDTIRESVNTLNPRDKYCVLMFDEISLQPLLAYNKQQQRMEGFQDTGDDNKSQKLADHAMVFMIKGLAKKWKQPVAYFFTQNGMSSADIAKQVKAIIRELTAVGITVVATVCDQYNKAAINMLVEETRRDAVHKGGQHETYTFIVEETEIYPLFDFPHLLKGIRNNMLKYLVKFIWKNGEETASWEHIEMLYALDQDEEDFRMLQKLTDEHVKRDRIKKMKVKHAAQVFSHRVQSTMRGLVKHGDNVLPPDALGTANFLLFVDKLFDSVNGSCLEPHDHKVLRRAVTKTTSHMQFWDEAITVLKSVTFTSPKKTFVPPTITNWILSLQNLKLLWRFLQTVGFDFLLTRNLNQDPLENFFSCIRSHGCRNINPSCTAFKASFKTLIVNNFMASHSQGANCEQDQTEGALTTLGNFLRHRQPHPEEDCIPLSYGDSYVFNLKPVNGSITLQIHGYMTGYMAKQLLKSTNFCKVCRHELATDFYAEEHNLIQWREYKPNALLKPRTKFVVLFGMCAQVLQTVLPKICHEQALHSKLLIIIKKTIPSTIFEVCRKHNLFSLFVNCFVSLYCHTWVSTINGILKGGKTCTSTSDPIKQQAMRIYMKYRSKHQKMRLQKQLQ